MSTYNNNRFTPGNKANLRQFINKEFIRQYYRTFNSNIINTDASAYNIKHRVYYKNNKDYHDHQTTKDLDQRPTKIDYNIFGPFQSLPRITIIPQ